MKIMTCAQMGGMCEEQITGATKDEMLDNGMRHLDAEHPEMAASVKAMPKDDPTMVAWMEKFEKDFNDTPEM
jgi:predicted small metal-binding protein